MEERKSAFTHRIRHKTQIVGLEPPVIHMSSYTTGGLRRLYKHISNPNVLNFPVFENGEFTDEKGHFRPGPGCIMASRYKVQYILNNRGQTAVLLQAQDLFCNKKAVVIKVMHAGLYKLGAQETRCLQHLTLADPEGISKTVRLQNTFTFDDHFCMVFQPLIALSLTEIFHDISKEKILVSIRKVTLQLLSTLGFLKQQNIIHADLKPENILLKKKGDLHSVTVIDFGNAIHHVHKEIALYYEDFELQTPLYRSPEVMFGLPFGTEIDMWSIGCILAELYQGKPLFPGTSKLDIVRKVTKLLGPFPSEIFQRGKFYHDLKKFTDPCQQAYGTEVLMEHLNCKDYTFADFLAGLLRFDPDERLNPYEAAQHQFLAQELPMCFLRPLSAGKTTSYPAVKIAPEKYRHKPVIAPHIKRSQPSTHDLLSIGTCYRDKPSSSKLPHNTQVATVNPLQRNLDQNLANHIKTGNDQCDDSSSEDNMSPLIRVLTAEQRLRLHSQPAFDVSVENHLARPNDSSLFLNNQTEKPRSNNPSNNSNFSVEQPFFESVQMNKQFKFCRKSFNVQDRVKVHDCQNIHKKITSVQPSTTQCYHTSDAEIQPIKLPDSTQTEQFTETMSSNSDASSDASSVHTENVLSNETFCVDSKITDAVKANEQLANGLDDKGFISQQITDRGRGCHSSCITQNNPRTNTEAQPSTPSRTKDRITLRESPCTKHTAIAVRGDDKTDIKMGDRQHVRDLKSLMKIITQEQARVESDLQERNDSMEIQHFNRDCASERKDSKGVNSSEKRRFSSPSETQHLNKTSPSETQHLNKTRPSETQHLNKTSPSKTQHLNKTSPSEIQHLSRGNPSKTQHLGRASPSKTHSSRTSPSKTKYVRGANPSKRYLSGASPSTKHLIRGIPAMRHLGKVDSADKEYFIINHSAGNRHFGETCPSERLSSNRSGSGEEACISRASSAELPQSGDIDRETTNVNVNTKCNKMYRDSEENMNKVTNSEQSHSGHLVSCKDNTQKILEKEYVSENYVNSGKLRSRLLLNGTDDQNVLSGQRPQEQKSLSEGKQFKTVQSLSRLEHHRKKHQKAKKKLHFTKALVPRKDQQARTKGMKRKVVEDEGSGTIDMHCKYRTHNPENETTIDPYTFQASPAKKKSSGKDALRKKNTRKILKADLPNQLISQQNKQLGENISARKRRAEKPLPMTCSIREVPCVENKPMSSKTINEDESVELENEKATHKRSTSAGTSLSDEQLTATRSSANSGINSSGLTNDVLLGCQKGTKSNNGFSNSNQRKKSISQLPAGCLKREPNKALLEEGKLENHSVGKKQEILKNDKYKRNSKFTTSDKSLKPTETRGKSDGCVDEVDGNTQLLSSNQGNRISLITGKQGNNEKKEIHKPAACGLKSFSYKRSTPGSVIIRKSPASNSQRIFNFNSLTSIVSSQSRQDVDINSDMDQETQWNLYQLNHKNKKSEKKGILAEQTCYSSDDSSEMELI